MGRPLRVLLVEDSEDDTLLILWQLHDVFEVTHHRVETAAALEAALDQREWDVVIADYYLPHFNGLKALQTVRLRGLDLPFILVSGIVGEETAVAAMKAGAQDYIKKDNLARLLPAVDREVNEAIVRRARREAERGWRHERERIAADLHDGVIQSLYAVALGLGTHERQLARDPASEETRAVLQEARTQINEVIRGIRHSILSLRPPEDGRRSLHAGLDVLGQELRTIAAMRVHLDLAPDTEGLLDPAGVDSVVSIAREATSNVVRHAGASEVTILLERTADRLRLAIRDEGRGFEPSRTADPANGHVAGQGLRNMAERARALGGQLSVASSPGAGTEVSLEIPVPER